MDDEDRKCLKIHGYVSESSSESDNDQSKAEFDELYRSHKPPPLEIDSKKHKIIRIHPNETTELNGTTSTVQQNLLYSSMVKTALQKVNNEPTTSTCINIDFVVKSDRPKSSRNQRKRLNKALRKTRELVKLNSNAESSPVPNGIQSQENNTRKISKRQRRKLKNTEAAKAEKLPNLQNDKKLSALKIGQRKNSISETEEKNITTKNKKIRKEILQSIVKGNLKSDKEPICTCLSFDLNCDKNFPPLRSIASEAKSREQCSNVLLTEEYKDLFFQTLFSDLHYYLRETLENCNVTIFQQYPGNFYTTFTSIHKYLNNMVEMAIEDNCFYMNFAQYKHMNCVAVITRQIAVTYEDVIYRIQTASKNKNGSHQKQKCNTLREKIVNGFLDTNIKDLTNYFFTYVDLVIWTTLCEEYAHRVIEDPIVVNGCRGFEHMYHNLNGVLADFLENAITGYVLLVSSTKNIPNSRDIKRLRSSIKKALEKNNFFYSRKTLGAVGYLWGDFVTAYFTRELDKCRRMFNTRPADAEGYFKINMLYCLDEDKKKVVVEDLTANRKYFYDNKYSKDSLHNWNDFLDWYLNASSAEFVDRLKSCDQFDSKDLKSTVPKEIQQNSEETQDSKDAESTVPKEIRQNSEEILDSENPKSTISKEIQQNSEETLDSKDAESTVPKEIRQNSEEILDSENPKSTISKEIQQNHSLREGTLDSKHSRFTVPKEIQQNSEETLDSKDAEFTISKEIQQNHSLREGTLDSKHSRSTVPKEIQQNSEETLDSKDAEFTASKEIQQNSEDTLDAEDPKSTISEEIQQNHYLREETLDSKDAEFTASKEIQQNSEDTLDSEDPKSTISEEIQQNHSLREETLDSKDSRSTVSKEIWQNSEETVDSKDAAESTVCKEIQQNSEETLDSKDAELTVSKEIKQKSEDTLDSEDPKSTISEEIQQNHSLREETLDSKDSRSTVFKEIQQNSEETVDSKDAAESTVFKEIRQNSEETLDSEDPKSTASKEIQQYHSLNEDLSKLLIVSNKTDEFNETMANIEPLNSALFVENNQQSQLQLSPLIIEDMTENRKYFYNSINYNENDDLDQWQTFQNRYLCECIPNLMSTYQNSSDEGVCKKSRRRRFKRKKNIKNVIKEDSNSENFLQYYFELLMMDDHSPEPWCTIRKLVLLLILRLIIPWILYFVSCIIINGIDIIILITLLLFLSIQFVINY